MFEINKYISSNSLFQKHNIPRNVITIETHCKSYDECLELKHAIYDVCTITDTSLSAKIADEDYPMVTFVRFSNRKMLLVLSINEDFSLSGNIIDCGARFPLLPAMAFDFIEQIAEHIKCDVRFKCIDIVKIGNVVDIKSDGGDTRYWISAVNWGDHVKLYQHEIDQEYTYEQYTNVVDQLNTVGKNHIKFPKTHDPDFNYTKFNKLLESDSLSYDYNFIDLLVTLNVSEEIDTDHINIFGIKHPYSYYSQNYKITEAHSNLEQVAPGKYVCYVYVPSDVRDVEITTKIVMI